jgi:hypothetical protein
MINPEKHLDLSPHVRGIRSYSWQEAQIKVGHILADLWLKDRHGSVDFWGVDDGGELMFMTFLARVHEIDKSLDAVNEVKWYYNCGTFDLGLPPGFKQKIWIKNLLSYKRIEVPGPTWDDVMSYGWTCLVIGKEDHQEMDEIYDSIVVEKNVIVNADEITERLRLFYRGLLNRPKDEIEKQFK